MLDSLRSLRHNHISALVLAVLILLNFFVYINLISDTLTSKYEVDWGEGTLLSISNYISEGYWPLEIDHNPYVALFYPPLMTSVVSLFGPPDQMLLAGRLISISAFFLSILVVYLICRKIDASRWVSLLCASSFILVTSARTWSSVYRVDMLAVFFSLLGLYVFLSYNGDGRKWLLAGIPLALAIWSKQSAMAAFLAIVVYLLISRRYKDTVLWITVWAVLVSIPAIVGTLLVGPDFIGGFTSQSWAPISLGRTSPLLQYVLMTSLGLLLLGLVGSWLSWSFPKARVIGIYFVLAFCLEMVLSSRIGSSTNYYMESLCLCCILAALFWSSGRERNLKYIALGLIFCQSIISLVYPQSYEGFQFPQKNQENIQKDISSRIEDDKYVLSDDISLSVLDRKEPCYESIMYRIHTLYGRIDESPLIERIENKEFDHIVIFTDDPFTYEGEDPGIPKEYRLWTVGMQKAITDNYEIEVAYPYSKRDAYRYYLLRRRLDA